MKITFCRKNVENGWLNIPCKCSSVIRDIIFVYLYSYVPEFTKLENWLPNSSVDYSVGGGAMQQMVYYHKISDTDQLISKCTNKRIIQNG